MTELVFGTSVPSIPFIRPYSGSKSSMIDFGSSAMVRPRATPVAPDPLPLVKPITGAAV